jgi:hypothetical protein
MFWWHCRYGKEFYFHNHIQTGCEATRSFILDNEVSIPEVERPEREAYNLTHVYYGHESKSHASMPSRYLSSAIAPAHIPFQSCNHSVQRDVSIDSHSSSFTRNLGRLT